MSFERWWPRLVLVVGGIGRMIAFYVGVRILLDAPHEKHPQPWLWLVALTLMGVGGAGVVEKALTLAGDFLTFLRTPPVTKPPDVPESRLDDTSDASPK